VYDDIRLAQSRPRPGASDVLSGRVRLSPFALSPWSCTVVGAVICATPKGEGQMGKLPYNEEDAHETQQQQKAVDCGLSPSSGSFCRGSTPRRNQDDDEGGDCASHIPPFASGQRADRRGAVAPQAAS
jgi:hypothetical protein